jgi:proteasome beta subunit
LSNLVCLDVFSPSLENNKLSFSLIAVSFIACTIHKAISDLAAKTLGFTASAMVIIVALLMKSVTRTKLAVTYFQQYRSINSLSSYTTIREMTTIVGIKTKEGVVLGSDKRASKGFFIGSKITQKIAKVDDTLAVAIAGQLSDAEYLIKVAKAERQLMELRRGFPLTAKESARLIANLAYSGLKNYQPYFVELLVAGVDQEGGHVYAADMSGAITSEDFASSGSGSPIAYGVLESMYHKEITNGEAEAMATKAVAAAMERDPGSGNGIEVLTIPNLLATVEMKK